MAILVFIAFLICSCLISFISYCVGYKSGVKGMKELFIINQKYEEEEREWWEANLQMLRSGALGDDTLPKTLLKYWQMQESAGYPNECENVKYFEDMLRRGSEDTE